MQYRAALADAATRIEIGTFHSRLRYVPTVPTLIASWKPHTKLLIPQHSFYTPSHSVLLLIILIHLQLYFITFSIDQREEQEWKDARLYTTAFISFRQGGFISFVESAKALRELSSLVVCK